jgi:hypothetical protein
VEPWPFGTGGQHVKGALEIRRHHRTPGLSDDHTETSLGLSQTAIETPSSLWKNHHDLPRLNQDNRLIDCLTIQPSQLERDPAKPSQDHLQAGDKQITSTQIPRAPEHAAPQQRDVEIAGMVGSNKHTALLRHRALDAKPETEPRDRPRQNP